MGLLQSPSWAAELRWSRLPWSLRILWLVAACIALRRAWDACDDAVARSWSALLFDEGHEEVLGRGNSSAGGRLVRRCAYGACAFVHESVLGLWERCTAASEAKDITLPSVLLALVGLGMQLLVLASNLMEAYLLRREGLLALGGLVLLEHKEAAYAWCDEQLGLPALVGSFLPPLGPATDWLAACFGAGDGLLMLDEVDEAELPALEDTAPPPPRSSREQRHGNGNGNGLLLRRRRRGSSGGGDGGAAGAEIGRLSSPGVVTRNTSRLLKRRMGGGGAIEAEEREVEEQPLLGVGAYQNGHHQHRYGSNGSSNGSSNGRRRHPSPPPSSAAASAVGAAAAGAASKRARPPPEGWLVYDEAAGLVPYEVAARWAASEADGNGPHRGNGHHHHHTHEEGQADAGVASKGDAGGRRGRSNGDGNGAVSPRSLPPVRMFGEQGAVGRRDGHR